MASKTSNNADGVEVENSETDNDIDFDEPKEMKASEDRARDLRIQKIRVKSAFTKAKNRFSRLIEDEFEVEDAESELKRVENYQADALTVLSELSYELMATGSLEDFEKVCGEMEKLEDDLSLVENQFAQSLSSLKAFEQVSTHL